MTHPGAVAIVAVDSDDRVLVVRQYRHAAQRHMLELPAGLLDVDGEDALDAAARELREEGQVEAEQWSELLTIWPSPGISEEVIFIFLAQQIRPSGIPDDFVAEHEEATMTRHWMPLNELVDVVLSNAAGNGVLIAGSLALAQLRSLERLP
ncbi:MAG: NUDIX hydrolase [Nocardioidaceae bacterium]